MKYLYLAIFFLLANYVKAQNQVVNQPFNGNTYYDISTHLKNLKNLPDSIVLRLSNHLDNTFGELRGFMEFSHGQIVYSEDIIKYDLNFQMKNISLGIISLYIQIKLTEDGRLVSINWPTTEYNNIFFTRDELFYFAKKYAQEKNIYKDDFHINVIYNKKQNKSCWQFMYPIKIENNNKKFNTIEVDWKELKIVDEYRTLISTVY